MMLVDQTAVRLSRAEALRPALTAMAAEHERDRRVSPRAIAMLRDADLISVMVPAQFGGAEQPPIAAVEIAMALGAGCGATAWVFGLAAVHSWAVATFPLQAQQEVWRDGPQSVLTGSYAPDPKRQRIEPVAGGFRISGRWGFGSGCDHSDWHLVQFLVPQEGVPPIGTFALIPSSDFTIDDTWHVMGLCGTGSQDVVLEDVFVPAHRTLAFADMNAGQTPGAALHANPIYALPFMSVMPLSLAGPVVGMARGALESLVASASSGGGDSAARGKFADHVVAHNWIGHAAAAVDVAALLLQTSARALASTAGDGRVLTVDERVRLRRDYAFAVKMCVDACQSLFNCAGASGVALASPIQRAWRDVNAAARHVGLNWEPYSVQWGRRAIGLDPKGLY